MLELKHISYAVREGDSELGILNDISLTIDDHRLVVFTGPNGGGKTTLAKIIMGLVKPTGRFGSAAPRSIRLKTRSRIPGPSFAVQPPLLQNKPPAIISPFLKSSLSYHSTDRSVPSNC